MVLLALCLFAKAKLLLLCLLSNLLSVNGPMWERTYAYIPFLILEVFLYEIVLVLIFYFQINVTHIYVIFLL